MKVAQMLKNNAAKVVMATGLTSVAGSAFAVDAAAAIAEITEGGTTISAIGMAVLGIVVTLAVFRYIKRAF